MVIGYWSVAILFWRLKIDHIVNVQCKRLTAVKRTSMRNALVSGPGRGNFPREILIETIAETGVKQSVVEQSSEIR